MAALTPIGHLSARDRAAVELVASLRQMTSGQIRDSLFAGLASATPLDRTLKRLVEQKYLSRLRRLVGGDSGGSGQFVYQLGRTGWRLLDKPGAYWAPRAVNLHTLAISDCYAALKRAEHRRDLAVIQFVAEPACQRVVGNILLTPDAFVEIGLHTQKSKCSYWLEVDRGTEHLDEIRRKCQRYWHAYQLWQSEYCPRVMYVVPDERRKRDIARVVEGGPTDAQQLFTVCTSTALPAALCGVVLLDGTPS
jgi:hypothetical protein